MCGIIHVKRNDGLMASKLVAKRFEKQKSRGTDGFGYIEINNGLVGAEVRATTEKEIMEKLKASTADEILFHHRYPTSTPNFIESTHPIKVSHKDLKYDYYVVHNGIINNDETLKAEHENDRFSYTTEIVKLWKTSGQTYKDTMFNDSESVAIDFALSIENGTEMKSEGSIAIVVLQVGKKSRKAIALYFGHNVGSPLKLESNGNFFAISSESGKELKTNMLGKFDYKLGTFTETEKKIGKSYPQQYNGYGYDYDGYARDNSYDNKDFAERTEKFYKQLEDGKRADKEENDFNMDLWEEKEMLLEELRKAELAGNWDLMTEVQMELDEIELDMLSVGHIQKEIGF